MYEPDPPWWRRIRGAGDAIRDPSQIRPMAQDATAVVMRRPPSPGDYIRSGSVSAAPESVVMSGLREHLPAVAGAVDATRRALRPVPGPNPFTAAAGLLGLDEPLGALEGPARGVGMLAEAAPMVNNAASRAAKEAAMNNAAEMVRGVAEDLGPIWKSRRKGADPDKVPGTYFHVVGEGYAPGDDLMSYSQLEAEGRAPAWKWDFDPADYPDRDDVALFDNFAEAEEFAREYGGTILRVDVPDGTEEFGVSGLGVYGVRGGINNEGYSYIGPQIPAEWVREVR